MHERFNYLYIICGNLGLDVVVQKENHFLCNPIANIPVSENIKVFEAEKKIFMTSFNFSNDKHL